MSRGGYDSGSSRSRQTKPNSRCKEKIAYIQSSEGRNSDSGSHTSDSASSVTSSELHKSSTSRKSNVSNRIGSSRKPKFLTQKMARTTEPPNGASARPGNDEEENSGSAKVASATLNAAPQHQARGETKQEAPIAKLQSFSVFLFVDLGSSAIRW